MTSEPSSQPIVVVACQVLQSLLEALMPDGLAQQVTYMDYGLHRIPQKMTGALQDVIDAVAQPSLIVLGYGLCGNGLDGVKAGPHHLLIPRTDDCIALLLGSREAYIEAFEGEPGTYYLSKGWLESGSHPLSEYEEVREKYGEDDAQWIMDTQYQHYQRLVLVTHNEDDMAAYRPLARQVADYCSRWGMSYHERIGSDGYVRRLVAAMRDPANAGTDFLLIPPGGEIKQRMFM